LPEAESDLPFAIDHIIAKQHKGRASDGNLALSCPFSNLHKGPNVAGIDPETGKFTSLFNPRRDRWADHFRWDGITILGISAVGRTTVLVLAMNDSRQIAARRAMLASGWLLRLDL
jgi:hypothetical protein